MYTFPQVFVSLCPRELTGKLISYRFHLLATEKLRLPVKWWKYRGGVLLGVICQMDHLTRLVKLLASFT